MSAQRLQFLVAATAMSIALAADRISKLLVLMWFKVEGQSVLLVPGCLSFTYRRNPGAAFSMFQDVRFGPLLFSLIAVAAVGFIAYMLHKHQGLPRKILVALGLIAGGAVGNMIDRIIPPHTVVDFIDCYISTHHWPAYNIADSAICIGAGLLILASFTDPQAFSRPSAPGSRR